jgi:ammonium transporter Rh
MFAAYWGLGASFGIHDKKVFHEKMRITKHSMMWAWFASLMLFMLWPSFVTVTLQGRVAMEGMNVTYAAGLGSILSAFIVAMGLQYKNKIRPEAYALGILAGPVSVSTGLFIFGVWGGFLVGLIGGLFSMLSFEFVEHPLEWLLGSKDYMGAHNLHGVCAWVSVFTAMAGLGICEGSRKDVAKMFYCAVISAAIAFVTGTFSGLLLKSTSGSEMPKSGIQYDDWYWFQIEAEEDRSADPFTHATEATEASV